jgi:outer membrane immunogenic protein
VFADYDFGNAKGKFDSNVNVTVLGSIVGSESEKSAWDLGARAGWLVTPQILSYWTGGYTATRFDGVTFTNAGTVTSAPMTIPSHTYHGWFVGGGVEAQSNWLPGLSFNTEYRFASYSSTTLTLGNSAAVVGAASLNIRPYVQTVMSGVRYKFNWTGH